MAYLVQMKLNEKPMTTEDLDKRRQAMDYSADLSDQEVRSVRAAAMGMSLRQYEQTLRHIGVDYSPKDSNKDWD